MLNATPHEPYDKKLQELRDHRAWILCEPIDTTGQRIGVRTTSSPRPKRRQQLKELRAAILQRQGQISLTHANHAWSMRWMRLSGIIKRIMAELCRAAEERSISSEPYITLAGYLGHVSIDVDEAGRRVINGFIADETFESARVLTARLQINDEAPLQRPAPRQVVGNLIQTHMNGQLPQLTHTAAEIKAIIDAKPGELNSEAIGQTVAKTPEHVRRVFRDQLKPCGYWSTQQGPASVYWPPRANP